MSPLPTNIPELNTDESEYVRLERPNTLQIALYHEILEGNDFTDTVMICQGGSVKVHGLLLSAASPFFGKMFESQGENYHFLRKILLPDFPVNEIKNLVELLYKGYVDLGSYKEAKDLQKILKFFQIDHVPLVSPRRVKENQRFSGSVKIKKAIKIPGDIQASKSESDKAIKKENTKLKSNRIPKMTLHQPPKPLTPKSNVPKPKKHSETHNEHDNAQVVEINKSGEDKIPDVNENDDGVEGWTQPDYKDKDWFDEALRRCVVCDEIYDCPREAAKCLELNHKNFVRCYLCSWGFPGTEILFKHYTLRHKPGLRDESVECPYCEETVSFTGLSSHVICMHFKSQDQNDEKQDVMELHSPTPPPPKKAKIENKKSGCGAGTLRVPNLDIVIEQRFGSGKTFQLRLQKERSKPPQPKLCKTK